MTTLPERILSGEVEAPDVFCGGTPCQAFSVAGLRNSLDDARGNLSLTFVGIANAIDHVRSVRSASPAIVFWENVPGVLSTKDNAFGCFLGALAGEDDPIIPSGEKWTNAGCVYGPQRTVAWRVLDAQYFGVAQRRRRVFVVASARDDFDPTAVLFEFDGVRRDTAPSREAGKEVAGTIAARFGISRNNHEECVSTYSTPAIGNIVTDDVSSCIARNTGGGGETQNPAFVLQPVCGQNGKDIVGTITAGFGGSKMGGPEVDAGLYIPISIHPVGSLCARTGQSISVQDADQGHLMAVAQPQAIPIHDQATRHAGKNGEKTMGKGNGLGIGQPGEPMNTLTKGDRHAVAQPVAFDGYNQTISETSQTIRADKTDGDHVGMVLQHMAVRRLTPVECERLQGFPDNYTNIPWRKKDESPDGPRYKALGNSWAVPNVRWIGKRIQEALNAIH
jgi:DNA (cytosine-5)-methyltransferase 1